MNVQWQPLAIGCALAAAIVTALWKCARLRGDTNREWGARIGKVEAALRERANGVLSILRRKIDTLIGGVDSPFDPSTQPADPSLLKSVQDFNLCISALREVRLHFAALLSLGNFGGAALLLLLVCDILGALHLSQLWLVPPRLLPWVISATYLAVVVGGCVVGAHWYLHWKLTEAELLSERRDLLDDKASR